MPEFSFRDESLNLFMEGGLPFEMKQPRYNAEKEAAVQEARDIMNGNISMKSYSSARELFAEPDDDPPADYKGIKQIHALGRLLK